MADSTVPRTAAGIRRRNTASRAATAQGSNRPAQQPGQMMKMYTDDSPGIQV